MGLIEDSEYKLPPRFIPKDFLRMIRIEDGPFEGNMAHPCICGYDTDVDDPDVALIRWFKNGDFMYVHRSCVQKDD